MRSGSAPLVESTSRLFFALWPDQATRAALDQIAANLHAHWGGRRMHSDTLHMTLAFLGDTPLARLDALRELAASMSGEAFTLTLDRPDCWQHNHVGWLGPASSPPALTEVVADLRQAMLASKFAFDDKRFVPHVTLLRNAQCGPPPICQPVMWRANDFVLLASRRQQPGYDVLGTWPLSVHADVPKSA